MPWIRRRFRLTPRSSDNCTHQRPQHRVPPGRGEAEVAASALRPHQPRDLAETSHPPSRPITRRSRLRASTEIDLVSHSGNSVSGALLSSQAAKRDPVDSVVWVLPPLDSIAHQHSLDVILAHEVVLKGARDFFERHILVGDQGHDFNFPGDYKFKRASINCGSSI
jgi:hypothetical protein